MHKMKSKLSVLVDIYRKHLGKRKRMIFVSIILAYPVWMLLLCYVMIVWPGYPIWAPLYRHTEPDMTMKEVHSIWAWNCWLQLIFLTGHPDISDAYAELIGAYRYLGRPDLIMVAKIFGSILVGWGFSSRVFVSLVFPYLLFEPYIPIRYVIKRIMRLALITIYVFVFSLTIFTVFF